MKTDLVVSVVALLVFLACVSVVLIALSVFVGKAFQLFLFSVGGLVVLATAEILSERRY